MSQQKVHDMFLEKLIKLFDWSDHSALHALLHVENAVNNLKADLAVKDRTIRELKEELEHWKEFADVTCPKCWIEELEKEEIKK